MKNDLALQIKAKSHICNYSDLLSFTLRDKPLVSFGIEHSAILCNSMGRKRDDVVLGPAAFCF